MQSLSDQYHSNLKQIRRLNSLTLAGLAFEEKAENSEQRTLERLRLATALFNDLQPEDYPLVRSLFNEEIKERRVGKSDQQYYNLRLAGYLVTRYKNPEDLWVLFEAHIADETFDLEHIMSLGKRAVYTYLDSVQHPDKGALIERIGDTVETAAYSVEVMAEWQNNQIDFLDVFKLPHKKEIDFAFIMREALQIRELLPEWIKCQDTWTQDNTLQYIGYARESRERQQEIRALELYLSKFNDALVPVFQERLKELQGAV